MKVIVTLLTKNDVPVEKLGENPEEKVRQAWEGVVGMLKLLFVDSDNHDDIDLLSIEIMGDE